ncbi:MAG: glycosyltransferase [Betaproteobacteria bacterium]|nr:glycosyltransferase [Betaproteobacteria bacterium]
MQFSVFTPTHRPDYIAEAFDSLLAQTCPDWEWVIVPNGPLAALPGRVLSDPRVRVIAAPDDIAAQGIGALKRFACERCQGDYLVELDHDDLLVPEALARIAEAAARTGAGFLYSDFANFRADGTCEVYGAAYGWESYPVHCNGRVYRDARVRGRRERAARDLFRPQPRSRLEPRGLCAGRRARRRAGRRRRLRSPLPHLPRRRGVSPHSRVLVPVPAVARGPQHLRAAQCRDPDRTKGDLQPLRVRAHRRMVPPERAADARPGRRRRLSARLHERRRARRRRDLRSAPGTAFFRQFGRRHPRLRLPRARPRMP